MNTYTYRPEPGDSAFQCLWRVEAEIEKLGYSIGPLQGSDPRGIMPADYEVAKWRNLRKRERDELVGVMKFIGRPRDPDAIIVEWKEGAP